MAEGGISVPKFQRSHSIIRSLSQDEEPVSIQVEKKQGHHLIKGLKKLRHAFTDVTLIVGSVRINAHRIILSAFSPYFEALLSPNMLEGTRSEIEIHELNGLIMEQLIDFAYTGTITYSHETVQDVLETANFLGVKLIQHECVKFIVQQLDSQNCADVYNLGRQLGEEVLFNSAMKYFIDNIVMISKSVDFLNMPDEMIDEVLKAEHLQYSEPGTVPSPANQEQAILNAVLLYVAHNVPKRLPLMPKFFKNIRLPTLLSSRLTALKEHALVKKSPESLKLVLEATTMKPELDVSKDADLWKKPRNNKLLTLISSRPFAGGGQISPVRDRYNDCDHVPLTAHLKAMKIYIRRWDGRPVWGGYDVTYSNGYTTHYGGQDYGHEVYEFTLDDDELITSLEINCGWLIDRVTFSTNKNRTLGPYGGPGGGTHQNRHSGKDPMGGYLVCMGGALVDTQGSPAVVCLRFHWAFGETRIPEPMITGSDYSDVDSGEGDYSEEIDSDVEEYSDEDFYNA